jgi:hypothetical protein
MIRIFILLCLSIISFVETQAQSVGINPTGAPPASSAMLDVVATDKGMLIPRVELVNATTPIASPVEGLIVYNEGGSIGANGFYYFDGTNWVKIGSGEGTVTEVTANSPLSVTNGTTTPDISLGTVGIANGGTGQTTANDALNALLPDQTGNNGKYLTTNGTNASWAAAGGGSSTFYSITIGSIYNMAASGSYFGTGTSAPQTDIARGRVWLIAPFDGRIVKIYASSESIVPGSTSISFRKNGSETDLETQTVDMASAATIYTFTFTGANFSQGERVHLWVDPTNALTSVDFSITIVWEFTP